MRRRKGLGHRRIDAAAALGVSWKTLMWWERDEHEPLDRYWPSVLSYLGYEPWPDAVSLADRVRAERRRRGLNLEEGAAAVGVDAATLWWWESGRRTPRYPRTKLLLDRFLAPAMLRAMAGEREPA
jgi:DNA-binding transcriptional regulator YiaG